MSAALAQIGKEEDKSWMFRLVRDQVAGIISKLNRGLRLDDGQNQHQQHDATQQLHGGGRGGSGYGRRPPSSSAQSVTSSPRPTLQRPHSRGGDANEPAATAAELTNTTDPGAAHRAGGGGGGAAAAALEDAAIRFDFEVSTDERGVRAVGGPVAVRTAARRPKNFGHSARLVEVERAAILQELIDLYELTASSAVDTDSREDTAQIGGGGAGGGGAGGGTMRAGGSPAGGQPLGQPRSASQGDDQEAVDEARFEQRRKLGMDFFKLDTTKVADDLHSLVETAHFSAGDKEEQPEVEPEPEPEEHGHLNRADAVAIGHFVHEAKEAYHQADEVADEEEGVGGDDGIKSAEGADEGAADWMPDEADAELSKAAMQIQSVQRGKAARKEVAQIRSSFEQEPASKMPTDGESAAAGAAGSAARVEPPYEIEQTPPTPQAAAATELLDELLG